MQVVVLKASLVPKVRTKTHLVSTVLASEELRNSLAFRVLLSFQQLACHLISITPKSFSLLCFPLLFDLTSDVWFPRREALISIPVMHPNTAMAEDLRQTDPREA